MNSRSSFICPLLLALSLLALTAPANDAAARGPRETLEVVAVRNTMPAVVNLSSEKRVFNRPSWNDEAGQRVNGMGSGVIIDQDGYIITNAHVVDKVTKLRATLSDGSVYAARTIGVDRETDLALVKIDADQKLPVIQMGISSDLMIAEPVIAVGNAYGYENTVTRGVISALGRTVRLNDELTYYNLIQTDASINPGNSGGALINIDGDLIGLNVAIRAGAQGISFAIPVDTVKKVAASLLNSQRLAQKWHGLDYQDCVNTSTGTAEVVVSRSSGPAQKAEIKSGDTILRIADTDVNCGLDIERAMLRAPVDHPVIVVLQRNGEEQSVQLTVEPLRKADPSPAELVWQKTGLKLSQVEAYQLQLSSNDLRGGMYVVQVRAQSPAAMAGIRSGDVIYGMEKWWTLKYDDISYVLSQVRNTISTHVLRNGTRYQIEVRLPD